MIGVGIIGAGHFGAAHAKAIARVEGLNLVAASRTNAAELDGFTTEFGGRGYVNWRALLADPDVGAVAIALPHDMHEEVAIAAAKAGKHIFLEKPMAPTAAACGRIIEAADNAGITLLTGHIMRFFRPCQQGQALVEQGAIGTPRFGTSYMIKRWMAGNRRDWHLKDTAGGGMMMTAGIHALDRLLFLMGDDVIAVSAMFGTLFHDQSADDSAVLCLRFRNGAMGTVQSIGFDVGMRSDRTEIIGTKGAIRVDPNSGAFLMQDDDWTLVPGSAEANAAARAVERQWQALRDAIAGTKALPFLPDYGLKIIEIIEAAKISSQTGVEVRLQPVQ